MAHNAEEGRGAWAVEPDDIVASADAVYRVEAVLWVPRGSPCVPVLGRTTDLLRVGDGVDRPVP